MGRLHVQRGIQFRRDLYQGPDRAAWFKAVGEELSKRGMTVKLGSNLLIKNAADAEALLKRITENKAGLSNDLWVPNTTTLDDYLADLVEALDDCVKPSSTVTDSVFELGPTTELSKLLGLDSPAKYGEKDTPIGKAELKAVSDVTGFEVSRSKGPADPLAGTAYIDKKTFVGEKSSGWSRDSVELEQVSGVTGVDGKALLAALRSTNAAGRTAYQRLRKPEACEAFAVGYSGVGLDELRWDADSHKLRERNRYVSLTIEGGYDSGRYEKNENGEREISVGTDKMDDFYVDTKNFDLLDADMTVRGRARWDTDTEIRRILVGVKSASVVDETGTKRNAKVDIRNDSAAPDDIKNLERDVLRARVNWGNSNRALPPMMGVYEAIAAKGALPNIGPHEGVLLLEPKVYMRSVRSRYHLNETSASELASFYEKTRAKATGLVALCEAAKGRLAGPELSAVEALAAKVKELDDPALLVARLAPKLKELDPAFGGTPEELKALLPSGIENNLWQKPTYDQLTVDKRKLVADALYDGYHEIASGLDQVRRSLSGVTDRSLDEVPAQLLAYLKATDSKQTSLRTFDPVLAKLDELCAKPSGELGPELQKFNDWAAEQKNAGNRRFKDFVPLDEARLKAARPNVLDEALKIHRYQIEEAGTAATMLWFDVARAYYVPKASRNTGNFLIDTTDKTEYVRPEDWKSIPEDQRTPAHELPADKVFHATLVNETQIELGEEKEYLNALTAYENELKADRASLFMKHLDASGQQGIDKNDPATYSAALSAILALAQPEKEAKLAALNQFLAEQKSPLAPISAEQLSMLTPELFTIERRDLPVRTEPTTERKLAGARFVFDQLIDVQKGVVSSKEARILRVLGEAGLQGAQWKRTEESKGVLALKAVRGGQR